MEIGRGRQVLADSMCDLGRMFSMLAAEDLIKPVFEVQPYEATASEQCIAFVKDAADLVMAQDITAPLRIRHHLFRVLMCYTPELVGDWLPNVNAVGQECAYEMESHYVVTFAKGWRQLLDQHRVEPLITPPDVLWLPVEHHSRFQRDDGISGLFLHKPGECALLCPVTYYPQIMWHEALHLCFGCDECYVEGTLARTCDLPSCIMQYDPHNSRPGAGPWLCEKQREHIRHRSTIKTRALV